MIIDLAIESEEFGLGRLIRGLVGRRCLRR